MEIKIIKSFSGLIKFKVICFLCISLFSAFSVYSNLQNINDVYGLYNAVEDNFKHLSPFHGFIFIEKNITKHYYEYGPENDPISILVKDLFKLDGYTFKATIRRDHIGIYLNSAAIGKILNVIEMNKNEEEMHDKLVKLLEAEVKKVLTKPADIRKAFGSTGKLTTQLSNFADRLVNSLIASGHFSKDGKLYPENTTQFILLSFLYAKINEKNDLKEYFAQFKDFNDGKGILKLDAKIWNIAYEANSQTDIFKDFKDQSKENLWNYVIQNYESIGFAIIALEKYGGEYPIYLSYKEALPEWFKGTPSPERYDYSGCMETALRNLLNFTFYLPGQFILPDIIDKNSIGGQFFQEFAISEISGKKAHDKWATIISDIPGVVYLRRSKKENSSIITERHTGGTIKPLEDDGWYYYELKPNLANVWKVANHIFNLKFKNFGDFLENFQLECAGEIEESKEQLECKITDKNLRDCTLNITPKHGEIKGFKAGGLEGLKIDEVLQEKLLSKDFVGFEIAVNLFRFDLLSTQLKNKGQELLDSGYLKSILMTQLLEDNTIKINLVGFLLKEIQNKLKTNWYIAFVKIIVHSLIKLNDSFTTQKILEKLAVYSSGDLIAWSKNLIEDQFNKNITNVTFDDWGTLFYQINQWRNDFHIEWITLQWIWSLLEKANPHAFFEMFINIPYFDFKHENINNFKELISKNFPAFAFESNIKLLIYFLRRIIGLVKLFGSDWVKTLIEVNKTKLNNDQKSFLLVTIIENRQEFDIDWIKGFILEVQQPSRALFNILVGKEYTFGKDWLRQLKTQWKEAEESEEETYSDESESEDSGEEMAD